MPLESASFISQLNPSYPAATDPLEQGDDHLRLIKSVLQAAFPTLNAAITSTPAQLNALFVMPVGVITMYGAGSAPTGWGLCNGTTYARADGSGTIVSPDLRDRFVVGAGTLSGASGTTGGASSAAPTISTVASVAVTGTTDAAGAVAAPTVAISATALTVDQLPAHTHTLQLGDSDTNAGIAANGSSFGSALATSSSVGTGATHTHTATVTGGGAGTHTHAFSGSIPSHTHTATAVPTVPPFYALQFIIKL